MNELRIRRHFNALGAPDDGGDWINESNLNREELKKSSPQYTALVSQAQQAQGLPE